MDIYGKVRNLQGDKWFMPFLYQGQYYDNEIDLCYNRFRYYDCNAGSYISQDSISILGGLNVYAYVHDPNTWIDIFGLDCSKALSNGQNIQELLDSGNLPDRNGLTRVGRALQKHSNRVR